MPFMTFLTVDLKPKLAAILSFVRETINKGIASQFIQFVAKTGLINAEAGMNVFTFQSTMGILKQERA
jgi:hypothetical protein